MRKNHTKIVCIKLVHLPYFYSVTINEGIQDPENWTQHSSFVTELFTVYSQ